MAGSILFIQRLQISRIGRAWAAMRDDELAAKAIGINTRNMKLLAFALMLTDQGKPFNAAEDNHSRLGVKHNLLGNVFLTNS